MDPWKTRNHSLEPHGDPNKDLNIFIWYLKKKHSVQPADKPTQYDT